MNEFSISNPQLRCRVLEPEPEMETDAPRRLECVHWKDFGEFKPQPFLWLDRILQGDMGVIYAKYYTAKTFFSLDLAYHIAAGLPLDDKRVTQCPVLYVAAEGQGGIVGRLEALRIFHNVNRAEVPIYVRKKALNLYAQSLDVDQIIFEAKETGAGIIFFDTLANSMAGGDENTAKDMNIVNDNCARIREATGAVIVLIHHAGKNPDAGPRGSTAIPGRNDFIFKLEKAGDVFTMTVEKVREGKDGTTFSFKLHEVEIARRETGETVTSAVVVPCEPGHAKLNLSGQPAECFRVLLNTLASYGQKPPEPLSGRGVPAGAKVVHLKTFRTEFRTSGVSRAKDNDGKDRAFNRAVKALKKKNIIQEYADYFWLVDKDLEP